MVEFNSKVSWFLESFITITLVPTNHHGTHAIESFIFTQKPTQSSLQSFVLINPHNRVEQKKIALFPPIGWQTNSCTAITGQLKFGWAKTINWQLWGWRCWCMNEPDNREFLAISIPTEPLFKVTETTWDNQSSAIDKPAGWMFWLSARKAMIFKVFRNKSEKPPKDSNAVGTNWIPISEFIVLVGHIFHISFL